MTANLGQMYQYASSPLPDESDGLYEEELSSFHAELRKLTVKTLPLWAIPVHSQVVGAFPLQQIWEDNQELFWKLFHLNMDRYVHVVGAWCWDGGGMGVSPYAIRKVYPLQEMVDFIGDAQIPFCKCFANKEYVSFIYACLDLGVDLSKVNLSMSSKRIAQIEEVITGFIDRYKYDAVERQNWKEVQLWIEENRGRFGDGDAESSVEEEWRILCEKTDQLDGCTVIPYLQKMYESNPRLALALAEEYKKVQMSRHTRKDLMDWLAGL